jgi:hypothetical protein
MSTCCRHGRGGSLGKGASAVWLTEIFIPNGPWYHAAIRITLADSCASVGLPPHPAHGPPRMHQACGITKVVRCLLTLASRMLGAYGTKGGWDTRDEYPSESHATRHTGMAAFAARQRSREHGSRRTSPDAAWPAGQAAVRAGAGRADGQCRVAVEHVAASGQKRPRRPPSHKRLASGFRLGLAKAWHALQRRPVQTRHHPRESVPAPSGSRAGVSGRVNRFRWPGARRRVPREW